MNSIEGEVATPQSDARGIVARAFSSARPLTGRVAQHSVSRNPDEWMSQAARDLILDGVPANTDRTYRSRWKIYVQWCGGTKRQHLPATEETVVEFIESLWRRPGRYGRPTAPATVRLFLDVISVAHRNAPRPERDQSGRIIRGYVSPTKSETVRRAFRGYAKRWAAAGHRPDKAHAFSMAEVEAMVATCDVRSPTGLLHALVLSLTYDAGFRRSEATAINWPDVELRVADENTVVGREDHVIVHVPMSKTDQAGEGDEVVLYAHPEEAAVTCPVRLMLSWRAMLRTREIPLQGPVLRTVLSPGSPPKDGTPRKGKITGDRLPDEALERILQLAAARSGVDEAREGERPRHIAPHGLRAGAVTAAAEDETVSPASIFEHFRFSKKSPVALGYMRHGRRKSQNPMRRAWVRRQTATVVEAPSPQTRAPGAEMVGDRRRELAVRGC